MSVSSSPPSSPAAVLRQAESSEGAKLSYTPQPGTWDEMLAPDGTVRPHWQTFVEAMESAGPGHWTARMAAIQRLLLDHGVTYNIYSDDQAASRPWALDAVPFLVAQEEWLTVAAGLQQRARLLNAILAEPEKWVLKPAFVSGAREPVFLDELSAAELADCLARLRSEPQAWLAQEALQLSSTPAWNSTGFPGIRGAAWQKNGLVSGNSCNWPAPHGTGTILRKRRAAAGTLSVR